MNVVFLFPKRLKGRLVFHAVYRSWLTNQLTAAGKSTVSSLITSSPRTDSIRNRLSSLHHHILKTKSKIRKQLTLNCLKKGEAQEAQG